MLEGFAVKMFPTDDAFKDDDLKRMLGALFTHLINGRGDFTWSIFDSNISYRAEAFAEPDVGVAWWGGIDVINSNLISVLPDGGVLERVIDRHKNIMKYSVPYYSFKFPFDRLDPAEYVIDATGNARIYSEPRYDSDVLSEAGYEILKLAGGVRQRDPAGQFLYVRNSLGVCGYVRNESIRSPLGPEFVFIKDCRYAQLGEWKLSAFDRLKPFPTKC